MMSLKPPASNSKCNLNSNNQLYNFSKINYFINEMGLYNMTNTLLQRLKILELFAKKKKKWTLLKYMGVDT